MAVRAIEAITGKSAGELVRHLGKTGVSFSDTGDPDILTAAALGIVSGRGGGTFDPDSNIQRQEAAVMLRNLCAALGMDVVGGAPPSGFSDAGTIASGLPARWIFRERPV